MIDAAFPAFQSALKEVEDMYSTTAEADYETTEASDRCSSSTEAVTPPTHFPSGEMKILDTIQRTEERLIAKYKRDGEPLNKVLAAQIKRTGQIQEKLLKEPSEKRRSQFFSSLSQQSLASGGFGDACLFVDSMTVVKFPHIGNDSKSAAISYLKHEAEIYKEIYDYQELKGKSVANIAVGFQGWGQVKRKTDADVIAPFVLIDRRAQSLRDAKRKRAIFTGKNAAERKICDRNKLDISIWLLKAIGGLEEMGIAHNDIKLANILVGRQGYENPVLCDFGGATAHGGLMSPPCKTGLLTLAYAAPERRVRKQTGYNEADVPHNGDKLIEKQDGSVLSDLFSAGVTISEIFAGESSITTPFEASGREDARDQSVGGEPTGVDKLMQTIGGPLDPEELGLSPSQITPAVASLMKLDNPPKLRAQLKAMKVNPEVADILAEKVLVGPLVKRGPLSSVVEDFEKLREKRHGEPSPYAGDGWRTYMTPEDHKGLDDDSLTKSSAEEAEQTKISTFAKLLIGGAVTATAVGLVLWGPSWETESLAPKAVKTKPSPKKSVTVAKSKKNSGRGRGAFRSRR